MLRHKAKRMPKNKAEAKALSWFHMEWQTLKAFLGGFMGGAVVGALAWLAVGILLGAWA